MISIAKPQGTTAMNTMIKTVTPRCNQTEHRKLVRLYEPPAGAEHADLAAIETSFFHTVFGYTLAICGWLGVAWWYGTVLAGARPSQHIVAVIAALVFTQAGRKFLGRLASAKTDPPVDDKAPCRPPLVA
jgi:hypothetical protein